MALNNDLPIRYSNLMYATKQEVQKDMKIPVVDNIWNKILEYRSNFQMVLSLKHITGSSYNVCLTPAITQLVSQVERKMIRAMVNFNKLSNGAKRKFKDDSYIEILRNVANKYNIQVEDDMLKNIVTGNASLIPPNMLVLTHYLQALEEVRTNYLDEIDDTFLGNIYSKILGDVELTEFYRENDDGLSFNRTIVNKVYLGVPYEAISRSMDELFAFIKNSNVSLFIKAACSFYYLYYVKPFDTFSEEISVLFLKGLFAHEDIEEVAAFMDFESLLNNSEELERVIIESQQTFDLTYILNYILKYADSRLNKFLDRLIETKRNEIALETYSTENEKVENTSEVSIEDKKEETHEIAYSNEEFSPVSYNKEIAIKALPAGLDEEEATKLENHLLELYPELKRAQAYFYARHCTLGMTYTISQFQRATACVYETARTSMDNLVYLGFYRKELNKNKYVYTPVKRK